MNHDMTKFLSIALLGAIVFVRTASAAEATTDEGSRTKAAVGQSTAEWLDMQREGRGGGNALPIPGAEAGPSYKRYIDSFAAPMPEQILPPSYGSRR